MRDLLGKLAQIEEGSMTKAAKKPTGPKFVGKWKGTDDASQAKNKLVGGGCEESIIKDLEKAITENPRTHSHKLMREYQEFLNEYGMTTGSQGLTGDSNQEPDPEEQQKAADQQQITKSVGQLSQPLNNQGAGQSLNKVKFTDVMNQLDDQPNADLNAQQLKQLEPMAVATSKALQNPQTAMQMKQLINKADTMNVQKQQKVEKMKQDVGTNQPAGQQAPQSPNAPGQTQQGQTK
jgi:hypothetical protein